MSVELQASGLVDALSDDDGGSDDDAGSNAGSDSSDGSMDSCFQIEDSDEDEARQRAMMGGRAGTSLVEAEDRARKRPRTDDATPPPGRALLPRRPPAAHRPKPVCAHCGEACRGMRRHSDAELASAADYGRDEAFAQHIGTRRGALQRLALAKLVVTRLCPPDIHMPLDLVETCAITSGCGPARLLLQQQTTGHDWGECELIYDDCLLIALKSERHSTVKLLLQQLPQQFPSVVTMIRPQTPCARPTIRWGKWPHPTTLLDAVAVLSATTRMAPLFSMLWELLPAATASEAAVWLRSLRMVGLTTADTHQAELRPLYAAIVDQFGTGGIGRDPAAEPAGTQLFSGPQCIAGRVLMPDSGAYRHILSPAALWAWTQHPFLRGRLCPYAQLLGHCPMLCARDTCLPGHPLGNVGCIMCDNIMTTTNDTTGRRLSRGHVPVAAAVFGCSNSHDDGLAPCTCCVVLEACQRRNCGRAAAALQGKASCADGRALLRDYLSLPTPTNGNCCGLFRRTDDAFRKVEIMFT
jgi:hypothetical protein